MRTRSESVDVVRQFAADPMGSDDPQAALVEQWTQIAGRYLKPRQLRVIVWLALNGSPDVAEMIVRTKKFQTNQTLLVKMVSEISAAAGLRKQLETKAEFNRVD